MVADCEALAADIRPTLYEALWATSASLTCRTRDVRLLPRLNLPFEGQTAEMGDRRFLADQCPTTGRGDRLGRRPMQKA
ncbi:hypothetical protein AN416_39185 (plasmid) [Paraburkholderia caribensis]|nr:hypothetical protein AN416_39185 [Paraburkholderia caribensis]AUT58073.1 hypothetical protein C2L66_40275 [Paraburkholderia caribensis]